MEKAKQYFCAKPNGKLHYPHTILTGFGFLASSIAWAIYDPYITKILNHLLNNSATITSWSAKLNAAFPALAEFAAANGEDVTTAAGGITLVPLFIGIIMTFDNIFGVIFQPTFGKLSDNTHSRFGKRRPYVIFGRAYLGYPLCDNPDSRDKSRFASADDALHHSLRLRHVALESSRRRAHARPDPQ